LRKRNEFMFLSSHRVPSFSEPAGLTETLASQRSDPSCMLPSFTPSQTRMARSAFRYSTASSAERRSGSETISRSGTPARLRSTPEAPGEASWTFLPASSSRWMRVSRMRLSPPSVTRSSPPPSQIGSSYCEIW